MLLWLIGEVCWALAYASDPSERTFAATAALIGAARLALISDICSRSGSCSTSWASSSCFESWPCFFIDINLLAPASDRRRWYVALADRRVLLGVGIGHRAVAQHVERDRRVDRRGYVGVDQRHLLPVGELLALLSLE